MTERTHAHDTAMTERTHAHDGRTPHASNSRRCDHATASPGGLPRRRVLASVAAVAGTGVGLAGCLEDDGVEDVPADPVALDDGVSCDVCGMVIEDHHGPAGQLFYTDGEPEDRDGPARFDSVTELVVYHEERRERGWELREAFVTDYSAVDYDLEERNDTTYITSHVAAETFVDATTVSYVVGSAVEGAMGRDYFPFSDDGDAAAFADDHGGELLAWEELAGVASA